MRLIQLKVSKTTHDSNSKFQSYWLVWNCAWKHKKEFICIASDYLSKIFKGNSPRDYVFLRPKLTHDFQILTSLCIAFLKNFHPMYDSGLSI